MLKIFASVVASVTVFSGLAMAQMGPARGFAGGPSIVTAQSGPGGGCMGGPMRSFGRTEMFIRRGRGPGMGFHGWGMRSWWTNPMIAQKIGLSDQQKQQLEKIHQDGQLKMIDLRADLEKQEVILGPMMRVFHPDQAQVLAQVDKVSQARAALQKARVETMLASRNVLTEEQWTKLQQTRMGFQGAFGRRGFRGPGGPDGPGASGQPPSQ